MNEPPFVVPVAAQVIDLLQEVPRHLQQLQSMDLPVEAYPDLDVCRSRLQGCDMVDCAVVDDLSVCVNQITVDAEAWHARLRFMDPMEALDASYTLAELSGALYQLGQENQLMVDEGLRRRAAA